MTLNCRGQLVDLSSPKIMGILNLTPDSFYDGGKFDSIDKSLKHCEKLINVLQAKRQLKFGGNFPFKIIECCDEFND